MGALNQNLPDEILTNFYESARKKFGDKKGSKRTALIEAIQDWTKKEIMSKKAFTSTTPLLSKIKT